MINNGSGDQLAPYSRIWVRTGCVAPLIGVDPDRTLYARTARSNGLEVRGGIEAALIQPVPARQRLPRLLGEAVSDTEYRPAEVTAA